MTIHLPPWALAPVAALALGCGGTGSNGLGDTGGPSSNPAPPHGGPSSDQPDATLSNFGDTDAELFMPGAAVDAGVANQAGPCTAGVYQGKYMTYVGAGGDGGSPGIFSFMWNGSLTIDLTAQKITMTSMTVGELPTTVTTSTLEIADGGALDGSDTMGGTFFANLVGSLDCAPDAGPPYHLTATLSNGEYKLPYFSTMMIGHLTADYQEAGAGTPSMLVNGQILVAGVWTDGGAPYASASGTWTATWIAAQ
jgi:hypothetical protein